MFYSDFFIIVRVGVWWRSFAVCDGDGRHAAGCVCVRVVVFVPRLAPCYRYVATIQFSKKRSKEIDYGTIAQFSTVVPRHSVLRSMRVRCGCVTNIVQIVSVMSDGMGSQHVPVVVLTYLQKKCLMRQKHRLWNFYVGINRNRFTFI